jgi:TolA-binding protein
VKLGGSITDTSGRTVTFSQTGKVVSTTLPSGVTVSVVPTNKYGVDLQPEYNVVRTPAPTIDTRMSIAEDYLRTPTVTISKPTTVSTKAFTYPGMPSSQVEAFSSVFKKGDVETVPMSVAPRMSIAPEVMGYTPTVDTSKKKTFMQRYGEMLTTPIIPSVTAAVAPTTKASTLAPGFLFRKTPISYAFPKVKATETVKVSELPMSIAPVGGAEFYTFGTTPTKSTTGVPKGILPLGMLGATIGQVTATPAEPTAYTPKLPELPKGLLEPGFQWSTNVEVSQAKQEIESGSIKEMTIAQNQLGKITNAKMKYYSQAETFAGQLNPIVEKEIPSIQKNIEAYFPAGTFTGKETDWGKTVSEALQREADSIDPYDVAAADRFKSKLNAIQVDYGILESKVSEAQKLEAKINPLVNKVKSLQEQEETQVLNINTMQMDRQARLNALKASDKLEARKKEVWAEGISGVKTGATQIISSPKILDKLSGATTIQAAVGSTLVSELGLGGLTSVRAIGGAFVARPYHIMRKDVTEAISAAKSGDKEAFGKEFSDVLMNLTPGVAHARAIYDWRDPESAEHGWKASTSWRGVTGLIEGATMGFGGIAGKGAGVTIGAASKISPLIKYGLPAVTVAGLTVPAGLAYAKGQSAISKMEGQKSELDKMFERGEITPKQYESSSKLLESQIATVKEEVGASSLARELTTSTGELAFVTVGTIGAAGITSGMAGKPAWINKFVSYPLQKAGLPGVPEPFRPTGTIQKVMGREVSSTGEISEYITAKGEVIQPPPLPKDIKFPWQKGETYLATYEDRGARTIGQVLKGVNPTVKTTLEYQPVAGKYPQYNALMIQEYPATGLKQITTLKAGATTSYAKVYDLMSGKLLQSFKTPPINLPAIVGQQSVELYTAWSKRAKPIYSPDESQVLQQVAVKKKLGMDVPVEGEGARMWAEGEVISRAKQKTGFLKPTEVGGSVGIVEYPYGKASKAVQYVDPDTGFKVEPVSFRYETPTKIRVGDPTQNIWRQKITENLRLPIGKKTIVQAPYGISEFDTEKLGGVIKTAQGQPFSFKQLPPGEEIFSTKISPAYYQTIQTRGPYIAQEGPGARTVAISAGRITETPMPYSVTQQSSTGAMAFGYYTPKPATTIWQDMGSGMKKYLSGLTSSRTGELYSFTTGVPVVWPSSTQASVGKWTGGATKIAEMPKVQLSTRGMQYVSQLAAPKAEFAMPVGLGLSAVTVPSLIGTVAGGTAMVSLLKGSQYTSPLRTPTIVTTPSIMTTPKLVLSSLISPLTTPKVTATPVIAPAVTPMTAKISSLIYASPVIPPFISTPTIGPVVLKFPTFGGLGGGMGEGTSRFFARRGSREWLVTNPIRYLEKEWMVKKTARQAAETAVLKGFGPVVPLSSSKISGMFKTRGKSIAGLI